MELNTIVEQKNQQEQESSMQSSIQSSMQSSMQEPKKRGRKKKMQDTNELLTEKQPPKKRGRRKKMEYTPPSELIDHHFSAEKIVEISQDDETDVKEQQVSFGNMNIIIQSIEKPVVNPFESFETPVKNPTKPKKQYDDDYGDRKKPSHTQVMVRGQSILTNVEQRRILEEYKVVEKTGTWLEKTTIWCWWCCHPFDTEPVVAPSKLTHMKYSVYGNFCSWSCAKSHIIDIKGDLSLLVSLRRMMENSKTTPIIQKAPPRQALKNFGGHLDIEEFRKMGDMPNIKFRYISDYIQITQHFIEKSTNETQTFQEPKPVLQRQKPLSNIPNTLESIFSCSP